MHIPKSQGRNEMPNRKGAENTIDINGSMLSEAGSQVMQSMTSINNGGQEYQIRNKNGEIIAKQCNDNLAVRLSGIFSKEKDNQSSKVSLVQSQEDEFAIT